MPEIRVKFALPFALRLSEGDYSTAAAGGPVRIGEGPIEETDPRTVVSATFPHADVADPVGIARLRRRDAEQLLRRTNHLLRWYRAVRRRADITELTRAQASPFRFEVIGGGGDPAWAADLEYEETGPTPRTLTVAQLTAEVQAGLATGTEPDVAVLFLLDAERALHQGRFREAVLFCWSTIDSVFNRKYNALANAGLAGEWADARAYFTGHIFGLRNKMSAGMHLLANRSLYREPDGLWGKLGDSYKRRNTIIHEGANATEDEATQALDVARRVVAIMNGIPVPGAAGA